MTFVLSNLNNATFDSNHASVPLYSTPNDGVTISGGTYTVYPNSLGNISWSDNNGGTPAAPAANDVVAVHTVVESGATNAPLGVIEYNLVQENAAQTGTFNSPQVGGIGAEVIAFNSTGVLVEQLNGYFPGQTVVNIDSSHTYFLLSTNNISEFFGTAPTSADLTFGTTQAAPEPSTAMLMPVMVVALLLARIPSVRSFLTGL